MSTTNDTVRQRTTAQAAPTSSLKEENIRSSKQAQDKEGPPDLSPDFKVVVSLFIGLITLIITYAYYRVDLRDHGPFSTFVNDKILGGNPWAQKVLLGGGPGEQRDEL